MKPELRPFPPSRRRSRSSNPHKAGDGHGERVYRPVRATNRLATREGRERRREALVALGERRSAYVDVLRKRVAKRDPKLAVEREEIREARKARRRERAEQWAEVARVEREAVALVARRKREARAARRRML